MWHILDFTEYTIRTLLLLYLCNDIIIRKEKYAKQGKFLFLLLSVVWEFWLDNSEWLRTLLYGENAEIERSSTSIIKLALTVSLIFLLVDVFYEGSRLIKAYLVLLFESVLELSRFGLHGVWSLCINAYSDWQVDRILYEGGSLEDYMMRMQVLEYVWNLLLLLSYFGITYLVIRMVLKYCYDMRNISRQGILFLMLPPAVGMVFDVILRFLFFVKTKEEFDFIYDRHHGMYAVIPVMVFLCLLSIVYSAKIYEELMRAQEEKSSLLFYRQQLADMTGHVQEIESLYDGIRSMRHDMNNYIADMEQLLSVSMRQENREAGTEAEAEAKQYLCHMKDAMENLSMKYSTGHPVTDVIMNRKWQECENEGICLTSDFYYPETLGIEAFDLGILMNNALDNAREACKKCVWKKDLQIRVHSYHKRRMFFLRIENDCNGRDLLYTEEHTLQTTKTDGEMHGIGLKNMRRVVDKYFGTMTYEIRDNVFLLTVMLQGPKEPPERDNS